MSLLNYVVTKIKDGVLSFINAVINANRDIPMHDYHMFADGDEPCSFAVGSGNMSSGGDQKKLFTSKSTVLYATENSTVRFNNNNNVAIAILANTWYEFYQNVHTLIVTAIGTQGYLYAYFEGAMPEESRIGSV